MCPCSCQPTPRWYTENMLTDKDINKIIAVVATKQDVRELGERIGKLENTLQGIVTGLYRLATAIEDLGIEYAAITSQLNRHEQWIRQIAKRAKVTLSD